MSAATKTILLTCMLTLANISIAETRYVTDQLKITLRSGESSSHRIIRMLTSGTAVEVISHNPETGYSHVKTANGLEGYVLERQLVSQPIARDQLRETRAEMARLADSAEQALSQLNEIKKHEQDTLSERKALEDDKRKAEQELVSLRRTSSNAVRIANERNALRKTVAELTQTNSELKLENQELRNESLRNWFLVGAGVLAIGIVMGLLLPNIKVRRRSSWDSSL